jgi:hypothetical protein
MRGLVTKLYNYSLSLGRVYLSIGFFLILLVLNRNSGSGDV